MVIDVADPFVAAKLDARLIKLLLRARRFITASAIHRLGERANLSGWACDVGRLWVPAGGLISLATGSAPRWADDRFGGCSPDNGFGSRQENIARSTRPVSFLPARARFPRLRSRRRDR
jgi:hypothetical protein